MSRGHWELAASFGRFSCCLRTGFLGWIGANLLYGVLSLVSAGLLHRGYRGKGQTVATAGLVLFAGVNGFVAAIACATGGACTQIVAVIAVIVPVQAAIVIVNGKHQSASL